MDCEQPCVAHVSRGLGQGANQGVQAQRQEIQRELRNLGLNRGPRLKACSQRKGGLKPRGMEKDQKNDQIIPVKHRCGCRDGRRPQMYSLRLVKPKGNELLEEESTPGSSASKGSLPSLLVKTGHGRGGTQVRPWEARF